MSTAELLTKQEYKYGFVTDIESDMIPRGLNEDTIRLIVEKKNEPEWMLEFRLKAFRNWLTMPEPTMITKQTGRNATPDLSALYPMTPCTKNVRK